MQNAFAGYTYQECVTSLLLAKMDVERNVNKIEIEAKVNHQFDDVKLELNGDEFNFQIKDFEKVSLEKLIVNNGNIKINGKTHKLSSKNNVIFFKSIDIVADCEILGIPAYKFNGIYVVSINRFEIERRIEDLYKVDYHRKYLIDRFFSECLDNRKFTIERNELPSIHVFQTHLIEPTVKIAVNILSTENILFIEGKPGVGKSHLVVNLEKEYKNNIVYRFWISNQDNEYNERLQYNNFILDFSKKLFGNLKLYSEEEIINEIKRLEKTIIIDGLDHVENYNLKDLDFYISFIDNLKENCKVIVLSRPLQRELIWKKQLLGNWNNEQTKAVLNELYHIEDYTTVQKVFKISAGYPILVRYIAEQYKLEGNIPDFDTIDTIDSYYDKIIKKEKGKQALSLFICVRSYIMQSEINLFLDSISASFVTEFIKEHPYLFEVRLNRISLFHDSFITYLRKRNINYDTVAVTVNTIVNSSILEGDKRFLSRFTYFDLSIQEKKNILKKYTSIEEFRCLMNGVIDFEAIQDFYSQIRETLPLLSSDDFEIREYYDLSLIINIVNRDHISSLNGFYYTYCKALLYNGYCFDDITSTRYLFAMLYKLETNDGSLLLNTTSNDHYDTSRFYKQLKEDELEEITFFEKHRKPLTSSSISKLLKDKNNWEYRKIITYVLEDLFIYDTNRKKYKRLYDSINLYVKGEDWKAKSILSDIISDLGLEEYQASWILKDAHKNLLSLGEIPKNNDYLNLSLKNYIIKYKKTGSFNMWVDTLNYIRLSLHQNRKIDLDSISLFWTKYYQRKDYSLYSLYAALPVFEKKGYIEMFDSICLITDIQDVSEKGYRGLLADYIMENPPELIKNILDCFHPTNLSISWFVLLPVYINVLPDSVYNLEIRNILKFHHYNKQIDYDEIKNLLDSNRLNQFRETLVFHRYRISIKEKSSEIIKKLKALKIPYETYKEQDYGSKESSGVSRLNKGILDNENKELITKKKLKSYEVAAFSDGNYAALANPEIFRVFSKEDIKTNIKAILYNAMTSRLRTIDHFHILWPFPGNIIKLLYENEVVDDFESLFQSLTIFLNMSMFDLNTNNKFDYSKTSNFQ